MQAEIFYIRDTQTILGMHDLCESSGRYSDMLLAAISIW